MKRKRLLVLGLPLLALVLALLVAPLLIDAERIKEAALAEIRRSSSYFVTAGDASARLRPSGLGLAIDVVRLASPDSSQVASVDRVECFVRLFPLLRKRVELRRIVLVRPVVALDATRRRAAEASRSPVLAFFGIESWEIREGTYRQRTPAGAYSIEGIDASGGLRWDAATGSEGTVSGSASGGSAEGAAGTFALPPLETTAAFRMNARGDSLFLPEVLLSSGPFDAVLSGKWGASEAGRWGGTLEGRAEPFPIEEVARQAPGWEEAPVRVTGTASLETVRLARDARSETTTVSGRASLSGIEIARKEGGVLLTRGEGTVVFTEASARLDPGRAFFGESPLRVAASFEAGSEPHVRADVTSTLLAKDLAPYLQTVRGLEGKIAVDVSVLVSLPSREPRVTGTVGLEDVAFALSERPVTDLDGTLDLQGTEGRLRLASARWAGIEVGTTQATLAWEKGALIVSDLRGAVNGGSVEGDLRFSKAGDGWIAASRVAITGCDLAPLASAWLPAGVLRGLADATVSLSGDPWKPDVDLVARVREGAFENLPAMSALASALGVPSAGAARWPFRDLRGSLRMREGRVVVDSLRCELPELAWSLAGTIAPAGVLALEGVVSADASRVTLPPAIQVLAEYVQDARGRVPIDFTLRGDARSPEVLLDWEAFAERAAATARDREAQTIEDALEDRIQDPETMEKLKRILRGGKP